MWKYDCHHKYFLEYLLGWRYPAGLKANKGSCTHKVLELIALCKKAQQDKQEKIIDDIVGELDVNNYILDDIFDKIYSHYSEAFAFQDWGEKDKKDCRKWTNSVLEFNEEDYNPAKRDIVDAEPEFDIELPYEWAKYEYKLPDNTVLSGQLHIKGTIDLISKIDDSTYEIIDYKTGKRTNFFTGELKTHAVLASDPQLLMYFYAAHHLYPSIDNFLVTIYFINDGGPFTLCFNKNDLGKAETLVKEVFEDIKKTKTPTLTKSWRCSKLCPFYKNTFKDTEIEPMIEFRAGQFTKIGEPMNICSQTEYMMGKNGMGWVLKNYKNPIHDFGSYKQPGAV
jgi:ATP-dependent helicase/DNAse subunit B